MYVCLLHYFYYKDKNRKTPPTIPDMFDYSYCVWLYYWKYKGFFRMHLISRSVSDGQDCILSLLASSSLLVVAVLDNSIPCCCCCRWCCRFFFLSAQSSNDWYSLEHGPSDSLLIFFTASVFAILLISKNKHWTTSRFNFGTQEEPDFAECPLFLGKIVQRFSSLQVTP